MKKFLLLSLFLLAISPVFGQSYTVFYSTGNITASCDGAVSVWHCNNSWERSPVNYTTGTKEEFDPESFRMAYGAVAANRYPGTLKNSNDLVAQSTPDIVVVREGHTVYLTEHIKYNGYIILEPGAVLAFNKVGGNRGRLEMNATSVIDMRGMPASDIISGSATDNGVASEFLIIGDQKINGKWIATIPSPIVTSKGSLIEIKITPALLGCLSGGYYDYGQAWTEEDLTALLICAGQNPNANPNVPAPVELLSFDANAQGNEVVLDWTIAKEWDFSHYEVEWSTDAETFYAAGSVSAKGTENGVQYYNFTHQPLETGTLYYRLLSVDIDGTVVVKGVRVVRVGREVFSAYTKQGRLYVNYNGPADSQLTLMDTMGRVVSTTVLSENGLETLGLKTGVYLVQVGNSLEKKIQRVLIQ